MVLYKYEIFSIKYSAFGVFTLFIALLFVCLCFFGVIENFQVSMLKFFLLFVFFLGSILILINNILLIVLKKNIIIVGPESIKIFPTFFYGLSTEIAIVDIEKVCLNERGKFRNESIIESRNPKKTYVFEESKFKNCKMNNLYLDLKSRVDR